MDWNTLIQVPCWTLLSDLCNEVRLMDSKLYKLEDNKFAVAVNNNAALEIIPDKRFVVVVMWACSDGAARRAILREIESDDGVVCSPPPELLPGDDCDYGSILRDLKDAGYKGIMETAAYRIAADGAFIHREIVCEIGTFLFRSRKHDDSEKVYAIERNLV